jgi:hypothetical protein
MPSTRTSRTLSREQKTIAVFAGCVAVLLAVWLFGFSLRAPLWSDRTTVVNGETVRVLRVSGISNVFTDHIQSLVTAGMLIGVASVAYLGCLWALRRGFKHSFAAAIVATALAAGAFLPGMPLTSPDAIHLAADVRTYWLHDGWKGTPPLPPLTGHRVNGPYPARFVGRPDVIDDPVAQQVVRFKTTPSGYGPVAYIVGGAPLPFVGDGLGANLLGLKVVAGVFLVLTAALAGLVARRLGQNAGLVTAMIGLNPLMLWQFPGDGHNDTIMAALGVAALLLVTEALWAKRAGGAALGAASVLSKFGLAIAAPIVAVHWFPRWRVWIAALAALVGAAIIFFVLIRRESGGFGTIGPLSAIAQTTPWGLLWKGLGHHPEQVRWLDSLALGVFLILAVLILLQHRLESLQDVAAATGLTIFVLLFVGLPGYLPWYQVWYLPFAALSGKRWLILTSLAFSIGTFAVVLSLNWNLDIPRLMGIDNPVEKSVVVLWTVVGVTAIAAYLADRNREMGARQPSTRSRRRSVQRRPIRSRS